MRGLRVQSLREGEPKAPTKADYCKNFQPIEDDNCDDAMWAGVTLDLFSPDAAGKFEYRYINGNQTVNVTQGNEIVTYYPVMEVAGRSCNEQVYAWD